uniref:Vta1 C-terminal domain-containing protein n=1 Tax=Labrus bergylta TaxID=56723 RepID=A0A3Q3FH36_9LABR
QTLKRAAGWLLTDTDCLTEQKQSSEVFVRSALWQDTHTNRPSGAAEENCESSLKDTSTEPRGFRSGFLTRGLRQRRTSVRHLRGPGPGSGSGPAPGIGFSPGPGPGASGAPNTNTNYNNIHIPPGAHAPANTPAELPPPSGQRLKPVPVPRSLPSVDPHCSTPSGVHLSPEDFTKAQKYCKYAGSALQYEDVGTAIQNLQNALKLLTTAKNEAFVLLRLIPPSPPSSVFPFSPLQRQSICR